MFPQRGRVGRDPNDWIRLLKKQVRHEYQISKSNNDPIKQEDGTEQIVPIPQVLR